MQALSEQARCRVVLLTRSDEMVTAALKAHFVGAVALELLDVDNVTAADYLARSQLDPPPSSWQELLDHLRHHSASPLARALNTPLTLTLVRDTYAATDDVAELLDDNEFSSRQVIEDHLLDRVLPAAYAPRLGTARPRYTPDLADCTLRYLAKHMNEDSTRDLAWWRIPQAVPAAPRIVLTGLVGGLAVGLADVFLVGLEAALGIELFSGWAVAGSGRGGEPPQRIGRLGRRSLIEALHCALFVGLVGGLAVVVLAWRWGLLRGGVKEWLTVGLVFGLTVGPAAGVALALSEPGSDDATSGGPLAAWRRDRNLGLLVGLVAGLTGGPVSGLTGGLVFGLTVGLGGGVMFAVISTKTWATALACTQLRITYRAPLRLIRFLEDARSRYVLRTVGPVYQFRHGRLQDRLAGMNSITMQEAAP